jgi:uncharacterized protein YdaU (DUF1376 family)
VGVQDGALMELPWYAHNIQDYDESTSDLTLQQHGVYRRMMDHYYKTRLPLPVPLPSLHRIVGAHTKGERADVSYILSRYFTLGPDGWHNARANKELAKAKRISERRAMAGAAGAQTKWQNAVKQTGNADGKPHGNEMANANISEQSTDTGLEPDGSKPKRVAPFVLPDWVPQKAWEGFIEVRKRAKSNPTDHAKELLIAKLERLKEQGFSPQECIEAAIESGWKSFYPPSQPRHVNGSGNQSTAHENLQQGTVLALKRLGAG